MANKNNKTNIKDERIEDVTMYGEFVSSFDQWMTPDRQKKKAEYLEEVTKELSPEVKNKDSKDKKKKQLK
ncbi:MAG: hypothetical protein GX660_10555 [Clostridiaceae bacterium]|nr:hypothetical protein [Clostridiaceae bacterium]